MKNTNATLTLIGSGEFGEGMGRVYREILSRTPEAVNAVFLDTPAGFEVNADAIAAKAADYFSGRLGVPLQIAGYKNQSRATALETSAALQTLHRADFIFAGPGSPSYAIRNWQNSPVWQAVVGRFESGAHLVFASAAAIAVGRVALPVYEIYKAGTELSWLDGMDLFTRLGMKLAIVPHWNNSEGGTYDTRFCYMGETRFRQLEAQLSSDITVLGIDEYSACIFDVGAETCRVMGAGNVTVRCNGHEWIYPAGSTFSFTALRTGGAATPPGQSVERKDVEIVEAPDAAATYLKQLADALEEAREPSTRRDLLDRAHDTMHEMSGEPLDASHTAKPSELVPLVGLLVEIRRELRSEKQYDLADQIRERLEDLGIVLEDTGDGTAWRKA